MNDWGFRNDSLVLLEMIEELMSACSTVVLDDGIYTCQPASRLRLSLLPRER